MKEAYTRVVAEAFCAAGTYSDSAAVAAGRAAAEAAPMSTRVARNDESGCADCSANGAMNVANDLRAGRVGENRLDGASKECHHRGWVR